MGSSNGGSSGNSHGGSSVGSRSSGNSNGGSGNGNRGSGIDLSLGGQVVGASSGHGGLISGDNSSVGVGDQSISVPGSVSVSGTVHGGGGNSSAVLGGEVLSLGGSNPRLVQGGQGTVGVPLQAIEALGSRGGDASSKNQKLHVDISVC